LLSGNSTMFPTYRRYLNRNKLYLTSSESMSPLSPCRCFQTLLQRYAL
jgi:hypothetical protein